MKSLTYSGSALRAEAPAEPDRMRIVDALLFAAWFVTSSLLGNGNDYTVTGQQSTAPSGLGALAYVVALFIVIVERKSAMALLRNALPLVAVVAIVIVSPLWAEDRSVASVQILHLVGSTLIALAFICRMRLKPFLETIVFLTVVEAVLSVFLAAAMPDIGRAADTGEWKGIFSTKNELGHAMLVGIISLWCLGGTSRKRRYDVYTYGLFALVLVGSKSGTALLVSAVFAVIAPFLLRTRASRNLKALVTTAAIASVAGLIYATGFIDFTPVFDLIGKDPTLTGRTALWQILLDAIASKPLLGYGYGVYWSDDGPGTTVVQKLVNWSPGQGHNGFIEVALNVGFVGEIALLIFLAIAIKRAFAMFWPGTDRIIAWPLFMIVAEILSNFTEASFERAHSLYWILFTVAFLFATQAWMASKARRAAERPLLTGDPLAAALRAG